jgi:hypothetical protein
MTEFDQSGNWVHTNIYAAGQLLATYNGSGLHFSITDPLGSVRVNANGNGVLESKPAPTCPLETSSTVPAQPKAPQNRSSPAKNGIVRVGST